MNNKKIRQSKEQLKRRSIKCYPPQQMQFSYVQNQNYNSSNIMYYNQSNYIADPSQYGTVYDKTYFCYGNMNNVNRNPNSRQYNSLQCQTNGIYTQNFTYQMYYINNNGYCIGNFY